MRHVSLLLALSVATADAATNYILRSAAGSATGADWANAFTNLPATLTRGDVYLIGDGDDYGSYNFNDAVSGSLYIRLQKATPSAHGTDTGWDDSYGDGQAIFRQIQIDRAYHIIDGVTGTSNEARGIKIEHDSTVAGSGGIYMTSTFTDSGEKRQIHLLTLELTQPSGDRHGDSSFYLYMNDTNGSWSDPILVVSNCYSHDVGGLNYKHNVGGWFVLVNNYFETCCMLDSSGHKELAKWDSTNAHARIYGNVFKDWQGFSVTGGLVIGGEGIDGYMRDWQIYNNLFVWTDRTSPGGVNTWSGGSRAIGGLDSSDTDHDDIHVWNNTFVNITDSTAANIFQNGTWSGVNTVSNNLFVACPGLNNINTTYKGSNAFFQCTSYTPGTYEFTIASDPLTDSGNGVAYLASDPGVGMDLSDFFSTDFAGDARPQGAAWDIGAFEFFISPTIVTNNASGSRVSGFRNLAMAVLPAPAGTSYVRKQDFEGTGYDNGQTWTESGSGILNEDYTSTVLVGSQSMNIDLTSNIGAAYGPLHTLVESPTIHYAYFQLRVISFPSSSFRIFSISNVLDVSISATSNLTVRPAVGTAVATVGMLEAGVAYHVWTSGSGQNVETASAATARVAFSTDGIRPTSGDNYAIDTDAGGSSGQNPAQVSLGSLQVGANYNIILDKIRVNDVVIGDNPE